MATSEAVLDQELDPELEALTATDPASIPPDVGDVDDGGLDADVLFDAVPPTAGLSTNQRIRARDRAMAAATLALQHNSEMHYTEDTPAQLAAQGGTPRRWDGIQTHRNARLGQFPAYADCSSFATWCLWNGLHLGFSAADVVNGESWSGGYTGSMLRHGSPVASADEMQRGDCVLYGDPGTTGKHTAIFVGRQSDGTLMVISHGGPGGPHFLKYDYRADIMGFRRYI
jgi:hypothetical protein